MTKSSQKVDITAEREINVTYQLYGELLSVICHRGDVNLGHTTTLEIDGS